MSAPFPRHRRLLAVLQRRATAARLLEGGGAGVAIAALVIILFLLSGLFRQAVGLPLCLLVIACGMLLGMVWGWVRRPSRLSTAARADQQLRLDDLLATAVAIHRGQDLANAWAASVLATVDAACTTVDPRQVVLRRLSARSWGAIGLCVAMAITLTIGFSTAANTAPGASTKVAHHAAAPAGGEIRRPLLAIAPESPLGTHVAGSGQDRHGPGGQRNPDQVAAAPQKPDANPSPSPQNTGGATVGEAGGQGSGFGKTKAASPVSASPHAADANSPGTAEVEIPGGKRSAAGGAAGLANASSTGGSHTGRTAAADASTLTPPWRSDRWSADVQAAQQQLSTGHVAPQYRDLVRKYFEK